MTRKKYRVEGHIRAWDQTMDFTLEYLARDQADALELLNTYLEERGIRAATDMPKEVG